MQGIQEPKLIILLSHPLCKEANFTVNEKNIDDFELINKLYNKINNLNKKVEN